ncbi:RluA family pseudouridine synthase [Pyxidicoccus sp. MSG2]|uniref:RluA family pseudouridine synthase n=1 Tax=Pyxidicoccus sp. MSG2 TaxID=2996790 RepID=UPI00226F219E|nr:RluA family pseudouridine synthase [Pyxidicoccus sp. MSG2]MCY1018047.1 RluA family pseudouridine synthase [Pyxidicoccus sp. MSG2]
MSEVPPPAVTYFEPPPSPAELPSRLASPFDPSPPHPLARRAAEELQSLLRRRDVAKDAGLDAPGGGKMFGVLVVASDDGRIGYLRAFSGMLGGRWHVEGFAPPLFDPIARDTFWPTGQEELRALELRHADPKGRDEVEHLRAERSRQLWRQLTDSYVLPNARGERQSLTALFEPEAPPGGAGDCAAPKLFAWAYQHRLRPLALAEFWWGAPPVTGRWLAGGYYPACQSKCGRVLPYMLEGLDVDPAPPGSTGPVPLEEPRLVFEDAWLLVVDKPHGLPSSPGRHAKQRDSVLARFQQRSPSKLSVVFALEAEASGLLLLAKDEETQAALRRQFARREADLRHVAWLDGSVAGDHGSIELPLRTTMDGHRVDAVHGKRAVSEWRVTERTGTRTRVTLLSRTRLAHQLQVHTAHPLGLGAPIVGDALYGREDTRLLLHAESLTFTHPRTGERLTFESRPPF